jgi:hypothetical protein
MNRLRCFSIVLCLSTFCLLICGGPAVAEDYCPDLLPPAAMGVDPMQQRITCRGTTDTVLNMLNSPVWTCANQARSYLQQQIMSALSVFESPTSCEEAFQNFPQLEAARDGLNAWITYLNCQIGQAPNRTVSQRLDNVKSFAENNFATPDNFLWLLCDLSAPEACPENLGDPAPPNSFFLIRSSAANVTEYIISKFRKLQSQGYSVTGFSCCWRTLYPDLPSDPPPVSLRCSFETPPPFTPESL